MGGDVKIKTLYGDVKMKLDPGIQNDEKRKLTNYVRNIKSFSIKLI